MTRGTNLIMRAAKGDREYPKNCLTAALRSNLTPRLRREIDEIPTQKYHRLPGVVNLQNADLGSNRGHRVPLFHCSAAF